MNVQVSLQMALYNIVDMDAKRQVGNYTFIKTLYFCKEQRDVATYSPDNHDQL